MAKHKGKANKAINEYCQYNTMILAAIIEAIKPKLPALKFTEAEPNRLHSMSTGLPSARASADHGNISVSICLVEDWLQISLLLIRDTDNRKVYLADPNAIELTGQIIYTLLQDHYATEIAKTRKHLTALRRRARSLTLEP